MVRFPVRRMTAWLFVPFVLAGTSALALETYRADLSGLNEVPPNASTATGVAHIVIDTSANTLRYHVSYSGLSGAETGAHIHGFAPVGVNGGVVHGLPAGQPKVGTWTYAEPDEANILAGLTYVNIHTTAFPGGEIRGQVVPDPTVELVAVMEGAQEVPPNASPGLGIGFFTIDTAANLLSYDIRYAGLSGGETAAHIHGPAPVGVNDADFAGGHDDVIYAVPIGDSAGTWTVEVTLLYQPIGYRWAHNLGQVDAAETQAWTGMYASLAHASSTPLARARAVVPPLAR